MARAAALLAAAACPVHGTMYDALSPELLPPAECSNGCANWSTKSASIWRTGEVPRGAGNACAQPGKVVNAHPSGPWCYCAGAAPAPPSPSSTHPLDGRVLTLRSASNQKYVSFAYTAHPDAVDEGAGNWMRCDYTAAKDIMPLLFKAVPGAANTYTLYNLFTGYEHWVGVSSSDASQKGDFPPDSGSGNYLAAHFEESKAVPVELVSQGGGSYVLINRGANGNGSYINEDQDTWVEAAATDVADALVVTLEDAGDATGTGYCTHANAVPEQINVQLATPDTVIVSFVTFEAAAPTQPPTLLIGTSEGSMTSIEGVTHVHVTAAKDRTYYMHFVRASGLSARKRYLYKVRSGGSGAATSAVFGFRAPYASGETRIDIYGDMGVYEDNNMYQLEQDCAQGSAADAIIHMGDHAYNEGDYDERRADGYFNAFQQTIANCPWIPVVGNHEYYAGAQLGRYLDSTWEKWGPIAGGDVAGNEFAEKSHKSTATSALGTFLSTGLHHGVGSSGSNPSGTSRYFSVDLGLVHLVALDLNLYFGVDPCGEPCKQAQLEWLAKDLAAANANRANVPWVAAFSHYPLYCTGCNTDAISAEYYASDMAERWGNGNVTAAAHWERSQRILARLHKHGPQSMERLQNWGYDGPKPTLRGSSDAIINEFAPILEKYSVDIYLAGHWHYYESLWPANKGTDSCLTCAEPTQKSFIDPKVFVHITTGAGGPGGTNGFCNSGQGAPDCDNLPATRMQSSETGYGRMIAHNATHLTFQQYLNKDSSLFDEFTIVQHKHPF